MGNSKNLKQEDLKHFSGTEQWFRHPLMRKVLYTEGAQHVAEQGGAYWLLDAIAFAQLIPAVAAESFQFWKLTVSPDQTATLDCEDGNFNRVYRQDIPFTDFPLPEIKFYFTDNVILLPSEY